MLGHLPISAAPLSAAPSSGGGGGVTVTPDAVSLVITLFAPTIAITAHQVVTPGVASLTLTTFAPSVLAPRVVEPGVASLVLTAFAPSVSLSNHVTVTPGVAALTLTLFAPDVQVGSGVSVVPGPATLTLTTFEPDVLIEPLVLPGVVIYGGDDAPGRRRKRRRQPQQEDVFRAMERTIHELLHPVERAALPDTHLPAPAPMVETLEEKLRDLLAVAGESHQLLQRAAQVRAEIQSVMDVQARQRALEEDDEEALVWMG